MIGSNTQLIKRLNQRADKLQNQKRKSFYSHWTPPKSQMKRYKYHKIWNLQQKWGYDYQIDQNLTSVTLRQLKEEFDTKLENYFGRAVIPHRMSRMDKVRLKEELGFKIAQNPVRKFYRRLNNKFQRILLRMEFDTLAKIK